MMACRVRTCARGPSGVASDAVHESVYTALAFIRANHQRLLRETRYTNYSMQKGLKATLGLDFKAFGRVTGGSLGASSGGE